MPTIPTGELERKLRAMYLSFLYNLSFDSSNLTEKVASFEARAKDLIAREGGRVAMLGALADFPVPRLLDLSPYAGTFYNETIQAAIQAGMVAGLNATDVAQQMFRAGMDKSFRRLNMLARTETVHAYWKNAFNSIADLPDLVMIWGAEHGPRTCQWCLERDGMVLDSPDIRDHPHGRCTPIPTLKSRVNYRGSVSRDGTMYWDPSWDKEGTATPVPVAPI